jgi:DNA polymerase I
MEHLPYQIVTTEVELQRAVEKLQSQDVIGFDTETTSLDPYRGRIRLIQLASSSDVFLFDLDKLAPNPQTDLLSPLKGLLAAHRPIKIAHNAKFDTKWLKAVLKTEVGGLFDSMLASLLMSTWNEQERHSLEATAGRYLNVTVDKTEQLSDWSGELSRSQLEYAARDASIMLPLRERMVEKLKESGLVRCAALEFECVLPVASLELAGLFMDRERWMEQLQISEAKRIKLADQLQEMLAAGTRQATLFGRAEINLDSHVQLVDALTRMGIPIPDSTRNWKLQPLAAQYPVIATLLEYRTVQKAITSYGQNLLDDIHPVTGRIHANFHQIGAPTGRFSCTQPNIQQIPHGVEYRRCFRAPSDRKLVVADYSQIELRILAEFSSDPAFIEAFNSGADLHRLTASQVFGLPVDQVTVEQRSFAKGLNFGVVYGIGAQRFSMMTGLSLSDAEDAMRRYFQTYPLLNSFLQDAAQRAVRNRQVNTLSGRVAYFNFNPNDREAVATVQRMGKNTPIQGTSADILKRALRILHGYLKERDAEIVNIIHDEVVVECRAEQAEEVSALVERAMKEAGEEYIKKVPVKVETHISDEWTK